MVPDFIIDPLELTFIRREGSVNKRVPDFLDFSVRVVPVPRIIRIGKLDFLDLFLIPSESEDIIASDKLGNFDVRSIPCSQGQSTVPPKFPVTRTAGLFSCQRNLF